MGTMGSGHRLVGGLFIFWGRTRSSFSSSTAFSLPASTGGALSTLLSSRRGLMIIAGVLIAITA